LEELPEDKITPSRKGKSLEGKNLSENFKEQDTELLPPTPSPKKRVKTSLREFPSPIKLSKTSVRQVVQKPIVWPPAKADAPLRNSVTQVKEFKFVTPARSRTPSRSVSATMNPGPRTPRTKSPAKPLLGKPEVVPETGDPLSLSEEEKETMDVGGTVRVKARAETTGVSPQ
jgi:hypothetical protein